MPKRFRNFDGCMVKDGSETRLSLTYTQIWSNCESVIGGKQNGFRFHRPAIPRHLARFFTATYRFPASAVSSSLRKNISCQRTGSIGPPAHHSLPVHTAAACILEVLGANLDCGARVFEAIGPDEEHALNDLETLLLRFRDEEGDAQEKLRLAANTLTWEFDRVHRRDFERRYV